jgi:biopolymer transport protein ExbD
VNLRSRRREDPEIGLTPLIDVVFLLLIFFMVSTTFSREAELRIELPEAAAAPAERPESSLEIAIDSQGAYYVNGQALVNTRIDTLKRAIEQVAGGSTELPLVISADAKAPHQAVVTAMDAAGQAGFVHLSISTKQPLDQD